MPSLMTMAKSGNSGASRNPAAECVLVSATQTQVSTAQRMHKLESEYGYSLVGGMGGGSDTSCVQDMNTPAHLAAFQGENNPQMRKKKKSPKSDKGTAEGQEDKDRSPSPPPFPFVRGGTTGPIYYPESAAPESRGWDVFRTLPPPLDNVKHGFVVDVSLQVLKVATFVVVFILLLTSAIISKSLFLLMTSAIGWAGQNTTICSNPMTVGAYANNSVIIENQHIVKWVWSVYLVICIPEFICIIKCFHRVWFRNVKKPSIFQFFLVFGIETIHAVGVGMFAFQVLPGVDAITGAMLGNCILFVPAVLLLLSRKPGKLTVILVFFDLLSIAAQSCGFWAWPVFLPKVTLDMWGLPISLAFISVAWWPNFVHSDSIFPFIKKLARVAGRLGEIRSKTYLIVSIWKCFIYLCCLFVFIGMKMPVKELMESNPFGHKPIKVIVWRPTLPQSKIPVSAGDFDEKLDLNKLMPTDSPNTKPTPPRSRNEINVNDRLELNQGAPGTVSSIIPPSLLGGRQNEATVKRRNRRDLWSRRDDRVVKIFYTKPYDALWVVLIQSLAAFICYQCGKFACKVMMQRLSFAAPIAAAVPLTVFILAAVCSNRSIDPCYMTGSMPYELFWRYQGANLSLADFFSSAQTWIWFAWFLSQLWITAHLWVPQCERLAHTDRLFILPWYSGTFCDQALALNRRRDDKAKVRTEDIDLEGEDGTSSGLYETISVITGGTQKTTPASICSEISSKMGAIGAKDVMASGSADSITKIYACATMWHETPIEMVCLLKSLLRLDEDQSARRNAQKYLKIVDPDYYEYEAHVFFDDAFEMNEYGEPIVNKFVKQLLEKVDEAASAVHQTQMRLKPPRKYGVPYGGRLMWILPGKNKLTVHLKDKTKIRHRKRWSQVMYLYYLLGYRLMQKVEDQSRKESISENTFILTLDGDVDFKPHGVHLLVDLMKKNRRLGAACGRIHPRGSGMMVWYQMFEYAIGHWMQKSTEHMIGCVLCAPGCFSLFRSCALMDDNVARKYATKSENPKDYIQYDQGEDRWLCTLLLQRGYRVEYCAASDALTFAPEGFNEFFNQRRRWIPSTIANIVDLLMDYKATISVNESISIWYIFYQFVMLMSSMLGPGTIFLMVVGAISISFDVGTSFSFLIVIIPVVSFSIVCLTCEADKQLLIAQVIGALFAMLMTAVIVGTTLQIKKDGIYSPHAIFLFAVIVSFFIAALLHPLEFNCIIPGVLYFMAIPCMYMLLPIYSICNLNVVSWGTRENPKDEQDFDPKSGRNKGHTYSILEAAQLEPGEIDGVYSVGCGNMCRFMCCLSPSAIGNSPQMSKITTQLEELDKKVEKLDRRIVGPNRRASMGVADHMNRPWGEQPLPEEEEILDEHFESMQHNKTVDHRLGQMNESWLSERCLRRAERDYIEEDEELFWKDVIEKYMSPLRLDKCEQDRIKSGLAELRNKVTFAFFMLNALFILIVFLLQMKKDCLHIEWPMGPTINHSIIPCNSDQREEIWVVTRLQLEPIGLVFLIFFVSILVIQFFAMLLHRFGTLSHILASTELFCYRKTIDKLSEDELVVQNAVEIARELQAIRGVDEHEDPEEPEDITISRRRVVHNLESSRRSMMKRRTETLDAAFKKRFFALSDSNTQHTPILGGRGRLTMRKGTIRALEHRRQTMFGTLDHNSENPYSQSGGGARNQGTEGDGQNGRGPARRRLDRLFHHKNGDVRSEQDASSSDEEGKKHNKTANNLPPRGGSAPAPTPVPCNPGSEQQSGETQSRRQLAWDPSRPAKPPPRQPKPIPSVTPKANIDEPLETIESRF